MTLRIPFLVLLLMGVLSGCDQTKDFLGLTRENPDASEVVAHAPLDVPPDFMMRPPTPGAERPQNIKARAQVQEKVFGAFQQTSQRVPMPNVQAPKVLLEKAGASQRSPQIRQVIAQDNIDDKGEETSLMEQLVHGSHKKDPIIDPHEELA